MPEQQEQQSQSFAFGNMSMHNSSITREDISQAAASLGRRGGLKGGPARAAKMTPEERRQSAVAAAKARWSTPAYDEITALTESGLKDETELARARELLGRIAQVGGPKWVMAMLVGIECEMEADLTPEPPR